MWRLHLTTAEIVIAVDLHQGRPGKTPGGICRRLQRGRLTGGSQRRLPWAKPDQSVFQILAVLKRRMQGHHRIPHLVHMVPVPGNRQQQLAATSETRRDREWDTPARSTVSQAKAAAMGEGT